MSDPVRIILVSNAAEEATAVKQELSRGGLYSTLERRSSVQEMIGPSAVRKRFGDRKCI